MKILIIGSGCREHALAWKFTLSEKTEKIFAAPGNSGITFEKKCQTLNVGDPALEQVQCELVQFAINEKIDLTIVGPEAPLAAGVVDKFRGVGLGIIGPDLKASQLEASKIYSKEFMNKYSIRTANSSNFTNANEAIIYAQKHFNKVNIPLVIKADGLAAGKGVVIAQNLAEAENTIFSFMKNESLGKAGTSILLEEYLEGKEVSVLAAVSVKDGKGTIIPFISARDHKRRFEGGKGPNTGGMGAIAPVPDFSLQAQNDFIKSILQPTLNGMKTQAFDYRGFIFFGLMVFNDKCSLLEYNVRLGDPETEAVLPLMDCDIVDLCYAILDGTLDVFPLKWKSGAVCAPVAVAEGYPGLYRKGDLISINWQALEEFNTKVFFGGAAINSQQELCTSGGRVLVVSAYGTDADEAWEKACLGLEAVNFSGMSFRRDIGREN